MSQTVFVKECKSWSSLRCISFALSWGMLIENSNIALSTSWQYVWHPASYILWEATFLPSHIVLLCARNSVCNWWFSLPFPQKKKVWSACSEPSLSHLDSCTLTNSNLYSTDSDSLISLLCDLDLYLFFIFQVSNIVSIFCSFGYSRGSLQAWSFVKHFTTRYFYVLTYLLHGAESFLRS